MFNNTGYSSSCYSLLGHCNCHPPLFRPTCVCVRVFDLASTALTDWPMNVRQGCSEDKVCVSRGCPDQDEREQPSCDLLDTGGGLSWYGCSTLSLFPSLRCYVTIGDWSRACSPDRPPDSRSEGVAQPPTPLATEINLCPPAFIPLPRWNSKPRCSRQKLAFAPTWTAY